MAKQDLVTEIYYSGAWHEVSAYVRDSISITRGKRDGQSGVEASQATLTLSNRDESLNPLNPTSDLYELIGRNTPLRLRKTGGHNYGDGYLYARGSTARAETPDHASLDVVGDIDIRIELQANDWGNIGLAAKYLTTGNQRSWGLWVTATGGLTFVWTTLGTAASGIQKSSTADLPLAVGTRMAVRVTLDVDNGAAGNTITFYYADTIAGPWTQLGSAVVTAGVTSIFSSSAAVEVGDASQVSTLFNDPDGRFIAFQLYSGIAGTLVADADFSGMTDTATFTDTAGRAWSTVGTAVFVPASIRFTGEIASWKPRRTSDFNKDTGRGDAWVEIEAAGVLRRLGQGADPLRSALTRSLLRGSPARFNASAVPVGYWPLEDEGDSTSPASAVPEVSAMGVVGTLEFGVESTVPGSAPLVRFIDSASGLIGAVAPGRYRSTWANTDGVAVSWIFSIGTETSGSAIFSADFQDTAGFSWGVTVALSGTTGFVITLKRWPTNDPASTTTISSTTQAINPVTYHMLHLMLNQTGADIFASLWWSEPSGPVLTGTVAAATLGKINRLRFDADATLNQLLFGHVIVHDTASISVSRMWSNTLGFLGEADVERVGRLALEEDIPFSLTGDSDAGVHMGVQPIDTFVEVLAGTERTGDAVLAEPRNLLGLSYRPVSDMYNQGVALALNYTDIAINPPLEYDIDDQSVSNDVTASRPGGSSARAVQETGPLNVNSPVDDPEGIGRVGRQVDVNPMSDNKLADHASWHLHKGVITETRFSRVSVDLTGADTDLVDAVSSVDAGDLITIDGMPSGDTPDQVRLLVIGYAETFGSHTRMVTFNCVPASPYVVGVLDDDQLGLLGSDGSTVASSFVAGVGTSLSVAVAAGYPLWTTGAVDFDVRVFGVRLHVTNIAGAATPQTFTVDQAPANGVAKTIPSGKRIDLFDSNYIGL